MLAASPYQMPRVKAEMSANPYAPPLGSAAAVAPEPSGAAVIRRQYLNHEAAVKSVGVLYYIGAVFILALGGMALYAALTMDVPELADRAFQIGVSFAYLMLGTVQAATGYGLRRLQRWSRPIAIVFSILGLFAFPLGTIISGYILYLLLSHKGGIVFSDHYHQVIARTPEIKYKSSFLVLLLLAILITLAIVSIIAVIALS